MNRNAAGWCRPFESFLAPKKRTPKGVLFFGARDGTRTHTAVATRTSNVIVYHSNTLASLFIISAKYIFVNIFLVRLAYFPMQCYNAQDIAYN